MSNVADIREFGPAAADDRKESQGGLGFTQILEILWRRKRLAVAVFVVLAAIALVQVAQREPVYTATTTIMVDAAAAGAPAGLEGLQGYGLGIDVIESQLEILRSYALARRVVDRLNLLTHPQYGAPEATGAGGAEGQATDDGLGARVAAVAALGREALGLTDGSETPEGAPADEAAGTVDGEAAADEAATAEANEEAASGLAKLLMKGLAVEQVGNSSVIRISFASNYPQLSQDVANAYAELYITQQLNAKLDAAEQASTWFGDQLERLRAETESAESNLEAFKRQNMLVDGMDETSLRQQIGEVNNEIIAVRSQLEADRAALANMQQFLEEGNAIAGDSVESDVVTELRQQLASLRQQRSELASQYAAQHPVMQNIDAEIAGLSSELRIEVRSYAGKLQNDVSASESRLGAMREQLSELNDALQEVLAASGELRVLEREAAAKRTMYDNLLGRAQEAQSFTVNRPDIWTVSEAVAPINPDAPSKTMLAALALVLAAGAGAFATLFAELMENGYRSEQEVEGALDLPVIGTLPVLRGRTSKILREVKHRPDGAFATEIRRIHATLQHRCARRGVGSVVAVTSSVGGEGVSSLVLAMARDLSACGQRVVVIDGEGKQARITELTGGTRNRVGLSDLLAGETVGEDARYKDKESEARIIPIGKSRVVALNMSNLSRFEDLLKDLRIEFDAVLIDCPALSRATDARFLSRIVDAVLVVVEWRKTPRVKVGRTIEHLSGRPDLPIMLALNKVQPRLVPQSTLSFRPADRAAA